MEKITRCIQRGFILLCCAGALLCAQDVPDPYRWLEDSHSPKVHEWVMAQTKKTDAYLAKIPEDKKIEARLHELFYVDSLSLPRQAGTRIFYKRVLANREQPAYFWRPDSKAKEEHLWLDPAKLPNHEHQSVGEWIPSPNGAYVAYASHVQGADEAVLHVRHVDSGAEQPKDVIAGANFADVSWSADSQGFYYMRLPVDKTIPDSERVASGDIRYHAVGQDASQDALIYPPTHDASKYLTPHVSADGLWLFVTVAQGWTGNEIYYRDSEGPVTRFMPLFTSTCAVADVAAWKDHFYLHTNLAAPNGKILRKKPQEENWETLIPERQDVTIESMHVVGGFLALVVLRHAVNKVEIYNLDGKKSWQLPIPDQGKVWEISGREDQNNLYVDYESFLVPTKIYRARLAERKLDVWKSTNIDVDPAQFKSDFVWYRSKDGTPISMLVIHRRDLIRNGQAPALMEGYGGFNTPILPRFSPEALVWLEMGGVYAVPHLRGGGEYGEAWHEAGMLTHKQNTFDDFIAAAEFLIKKKYTGADHLAIQGASNGGLLVTAAMTQRPDLFRAVICKNPITDMVRYPLFGEGKAWVPEYGSPDKPDEFKALLAYSPYHHVTLGTSYPSLFMFAGEHDDRVDPMHARKFVAAIQAANSSSHPILFNLLQHAGHSGSDHLAAQTQETTERLSFLKKELDLPIQ